MINPFELWWALLCWPFDRRRLRLKGARKAANGYGVSWGQWHDAGSYNARLDQPR
jgi:hypothetical protein